MQAQLNWFYSILPAFDGARPWRECCFYPAALALYSVLLFAVLAVLARRYGSRHAAEVWYLRARNIHPLRSLVAFCTYLLFIGALILAGTLHRASFPVGGWAFGLVCGFAAYSGAVLFGGTLAAAIGLPRANGPAALRQPAAVCLFVGILWTVGRYVYALPAGSAHAPLIGSLLIFISYVILARLGVMILALFVVGGVRRPSPRLRLLAEEASRGSGLARKPRLVEIIEPRANAFAMQGIRMVGVTSGALDLLSDRELVNVLRHEFAHLGESALQQSMRFLPLLLYFVFLGGWPIVAPHGGWWFIPAFIVILVAARVLGARISRALEERADSNAVAGDDEAVYAGALERLYQHNLFPAVVRKGMASHPNLYDRMTAAGVVPAYPRPAPPAAAFRTACSLVVLLASTMLFASLVVVRYKSTQLQEQAAYQAEYEDDFDAATAPDEEPSE